ncbi:type III-B CRISPR module-associated protein Cmr3 [Acidilutibacter cellobiosedens]|jgi:CRISPR-associated protein Cmr3|uniref:Type III-B CRISPR module-associated protein Cmr3 n=1 Tax=Acidilutibacter cellobiosedens TaxID=2507161 RepID=A0A410QAW5_9FIRM|nr:type III-B CRISPR module-associated protein Cmr3 [Acidilutibacter cellobiosedens]QAT61162.1 type III-B CRISPR module-associated protein Cmr3 [Acidilutibacter cellobiosedens]
MKLLKLKPCDNTFFRDGKVFKMGYNNIIQSKNIPYPSVFSGAVFTAFLANNEGLKKKFMKNPSVKEKRKILKIGQVYLYNERTRDIYIPAPKDLFKDEDGEIYFGKFDDLAEGMTSLPYKKALMSPNIDGIERISKEFINIKNIFREYKNKSYLGMDLVHEDEIFKKNYKVGIGTDYDKRIVKEDLLYRVEQTEFLSNDWSFIVEYDINIKLIKEKKIGNIEELKKGYLKLGGENKICKYEECDKWVNDYINEFRKNAEDNYKINSSIIKLIFTSPVYFKGENDLNKIGVIGISSDKPIYIGGFDIKEKAAKQMYKGYEAGTVFLIMENKFETIKNRLETSIGDLINEGFGKYIILEEE